MTGLILLTKGSALGLNLSGNCPIRHLVTLRLVSANSVEGIYGISKWCVGCQYVSEWLVRTGQVIEGQLRTG